MSEVRDPDSDGEQPTPPVPPADREVVVPEDRRGSRVVESEFVKHCDCGGRVHREKVATGRLVILLWENERWDGDEYATHAQHEEVQVRTSCERCGMEVVI